MAQVRLIVVSNRGPVAFERSEGGRIATRRSGGGLATALRGLAAEYDVTWIASAITEADRELAELLGGQTREVEVARDATARLSLIAHDARAYDRFYHTVANPLLWFVHHQLGAPTGAPTSGRALSTVWDQGYAAVNERFADAVVAALGAAPDALVVFHDYHLYLAPALVRRRVPEAALAHVVHVPWLPAESWSGLPAGVRREIHEGVLANDLVVFQTERWRVNFLRCCAAFTAARVDESAGSVRLAGRQALARARAVSVDPAELAALAASPPVETEAAALRGSRPEKLILRVDRADPAKNIVRGFAAYALLLARHPELLGRVGMLALLHPSRQAVRDYAEYEAAIRSHAEALNARFARGSWQPLRLRIEDNVAAALAAYREYDVLLANSVYDGMNLVVKEGPLLNERSGVVVLSENAGAFEELAAHVVGINPFDVSDQADALLRALCMDAEERLRRGTAICRHTKRYNASAWGRWHVRELRATPAGRGRRIQGGV